MNRKSKKDRIKKIKDKPVFELVKGILGHQHNSKRYLSEMKQRYVNFVYGYKGKNFFQVYKHLLNNENFRKVSPIFSLDFESAPSEILFDEIAVELLLDVLLTPVTLLSKELAEFESNRVMFEESLVLGNYEKTSQILEDIYKTQGDSIWLIKAKMLLLSQCGEHESLANFIQHYQRKDPDTQILQIVKNFVSIFEVGDPKLALNNTILKHINEFKDGDALNLAGIHDLLYLPFPSPFDIHPYYSLKELQNFNYIDLYVYLKEALIQADVINRTSINTNYDDRIHARIAEIISLVSPKWNVEERSSNRHLQWYKSYDFLKIINDLESIKELDSSLIINLNIYAKCYVNLDRKPPKTLPIFLLTCIENLINIYSLKNVQQSISELEAIIFYTLCFDISKHVTIALEKALLYNSSQLNRLKISLLSRYTILGGTEATLQVSHSSFNNLIKDGFNEKEKAKCYYLNFPSDDSLAAYTKFEPLYKDILEVKATQFLTHSRYDELLDFVVCELMKNELSYICFPMRKISNYIDKERLESENAVIFYYFYSLLLDNDGTDALNQIFDEFILSNGIDRPSQYFELVEHINDKEFLILSEISKVSVMDYMGCFNGTSDLMYERINILDFLKLDPRTDNSKLESEYQDTLKEILLHEATAPLNTAKIFVDKQSIIKINKGKINTLVDHFFQVKHVYAISKSEDDFIKINNTLVDLYGVIMNEYLNNLEHGLDSNLSGEIRHTYFSNLLTSKPEHYNLLTEIGTDGKYKKNEYWLDEYKIVNPKITDEIDSRMSEFSESFNDLISEVEGWMKVSSDDSKPERVFVFKDPNLAFKTVLNTFLTCKSSEELVNVIFDSLDSQLNICLRDMRNKIDHDFAIALDELFDNLLIDVQRIKRAASLTNLISSIHSAKNDIKEDVKAASDWFNLRNNKVFSSYPISEVITIAERCFKPNRNYVQQIKLLTIEDIQISGLYVPKLIMALNNCFANAKKHMNDEELIEIEILREEEKSYKIRILNGISAAHEQALLSSELDEARKKLRYMDENSLLIKEGGTGLYKSKFKLRSMSEKFDLTIAVETGKFITEVSYNE